MTNKNQSSETSGIEKARELKERLNVMKKDVESQWPDVLEISSTLYAARKKNHFAELIMNAMGKSDES